MLYILAMYTKYIFVIYTEYLLHTYILSQINVCMCACVCLEVFKPRISYINPCVPFSNPVNDT